MSGTWDDVARWWVDAVRDDPANSDDFFELVRQLDAGVDESGSLTLDVGCGEGQGMRSITGHVIGTDASMPLLAHARDAGPVVCGRLPDLGWARSEVFDVCVCVGVLELIADLPRLLRELRRVTKVGGHLIVAMNHPVVTAPHAEALVDPTGEVLWRWGRYLAPGEIEQELGERSVTMHHRPMGALLTTAAAAGWELDRLIEHGPSRATLARHDGYTGQEHVPTLLGVRWTASRPDDRSNA